LYENHALPSLFFFFFQLNLNGVLPVTKYKSSLTGLTVVFASAESPIVNGYFCLPTEAYDDDGLPHTLEHLIFLGRFVSWHDFVFVVFFMRSSAIDCRCRPPPQ
jgi:hypothetical protein